MPQLESGTGLAKLIFDLGDLLERHIRKEERELFPLFEAHVDAAQAEQVGAKLKELLNPQSASMKPTNRSVCRGQSISFSNTWRRFFVCGRTWPGQRPSSMALSHAGLVSTSGLSNS